MLASPCLFTKKEEGCFWKLTYVRLFYTYDRNFLIALGLQYFNASVTYVVLSLGLLDVFKSEYELEPSVTTELNVIILFPFALKLFYGIITDMLPVCGSQKRSYIIMMGIV